MAEITNIYYLTISVGQEFEYVFVGWFWLRVTHEVMVKMSVGLQAVKTWLELKDPFPSWRTHRAITKESLLLAIWASTQGFLSFFKTWQLDSLRVNDLWKKKRPRAGLLHVQLCVTLCTVAHQTPLSMGFFK